MIYWKTPQDNGEKIAGFEVTYYPVSHTITIIIIYIAEVPLYCRDAQGPCQLGSHLELKTFNSSTLFIIMSS